MTRPKQWVFLLLLVAVTACIGTRSKAPEPWFDRDELTIAVVDSGLGGLSVAAELEQRVSAARSFRQVRIVFFNALFASQGGYNSVRSREEKVQWFDRALAALDRRYQPDLILVACNTLSVLIEHTVFASHSRTRLHSIVDPGVALISEALTSHPDGQVLLFGTRTTVAEDSHRKVVAAAGLDTGRLVTQACPELASAIELGFDSDETELLIATFVDEAVTRLAPSPGPVFAALCCSHYPYAERLWQLALADYDIGPVTLLNPNQAMVDQLLNTPLTPRFAATATAVSVVSKVEISADRRRSISSALRPVSPQTADALLSYQWQPDLF